jgi:hypothetical protein
MPKYPLILRGDGALVFIALFLILAFKRIIGEIPINKLRLVSGVLLAVTATTLIIYSERVRVWIARDSLCRRMRHHYYRFFVYFDPDLASRPKYNRTNTANYIIEQVLLFLPVDA